MAELDAYFGMKQFAAGELGEKSMLPRKWRNSPSVAKLRPIEACLAHDLFDFHVLDLAQLVGGNSRPSRRSARASMRGGQQAANFVGAQGGFTCMVFTP